MTSHLVYCSLLKLSTPAIHTNVLPKKIYATQMSSSGDKKAATRTKEDADLLRNVVISVLIQTR